MVFHLYIRTDNVQVILENSFPSSFDRKAKQLPHTMYAVPCDHKEHHTTPLLGQQEERALPVYI